MRGAQSKYVKSFLIEVRESHTKRNIIVEVEKFQTYAELKSKLKNKLDVNHSKGSPSNTNLVIIIKLFI